jgi:hypothetical protein
MHVLWNTHTSYTGKHIVHGSNSIESLFLQLQRTINLVSQHGNNLSCVVGGAPLKLQFTPWNVQLVVDSVTKKIRLQYILVTNSITQSTYFRSALKKKCLGQNFPHLATKTSLIHEFVFAKNSRQILCFFFPPWNFHIYTIGCSMPQNFLFSSMACSQIWLSPLVDGSQPTNLTDFPKNKKTHWFKQIAKI